MSFKVTVSLGAYWACFSMKVVISEYYFLWVNEGHYKFNKRDDKKDCRRTSVNYKMIIGMK